MQLQSMQKNESDLLKQLADSEGVIKSRKDDLRREEAFRTELEEKFAEEAKEIETQINTLKERFDSSAKELAEIRSIFHISTFYFVTFFLSNDFHSFLSLSRYFNQLLRGSK